MLPVIQLPSVVGRMVHGGSKPLRFDSGQQIGISSYLTFGARRQFAYEVEKSVLDIFGTETEARSEDQ